MAYEPPPLTILPEHLGNPNVLMPIEKFVDLLIAEIESSPHKPRQNEDDKKRYISVFKERGIHYAGQFLFYDISGKDMGSFYCCRACRKLQLERGIYIRFLSTSPEWQKKIYGIDIELGKHIYASPGIRADDRHLYSHQKAIFKNTNPERIKKALTELFELDGANPTSHLSRILGDATDATLSGLLQISLDPAIQARLKNFSAETAQRFTESVLYDDTLTRLLKQGLLEEWENHGKDALGKKAIDKKQEHTSSLSVVLISGTNKLRYQLLASAFNEVGAENFAARIQATLIASDAIQNRARVIAEEFHQRLRLV